MDATILSGSAGATKVGMASQRRPAYLLPIWLLTVTYLAFELGFNARLLDVAGGLATPQQIDSIEHAGRLISGIALALAVWGVIIMPRGTERQWSVGRWTAMLGITALVSIVTVYNAERMLVDELVEHSDGEARRIAAHLALLSHGILTQQVEIDGIDLSADQLNGPAGRAFVALFPVLAFSTNDLATKAATALRQVIKNGVTAAMGSPAQYYNRAFIPSVREIRDAYNRYADGVNQMHRAVDDIPTTQQQAWDRYVTDLQKKGYRPNTVPAMGHGRVRDAVRRQGVPVPNDWQPNDQAGFDRAVRGKVESEAAQKYRSQVASQFGAGVSLPDDLQWAAFVANPSVQAKWRMALDLPPSVTLSPGLDVAAFTRIAYTPRLDRTVDTEVAKYQSADADFGPGGKNQRLGEDAMRALLVPPIALGFSLIGALVHIVKAGLFSARFVSPRKQLNLALIGGSLVLVAVSAFLAPNAISQSRAFSYLRGQTAMVLGSVPAQALTWVVQAEPYAYPVDEAVRTNVLFGLSFGYEPSGKLPDASSPS